MLNPNGKPFFWGITGNGPQSKLGAGGLCVEADEGLAFGLLFHFGFVPWVLASRRRGPAPRGCDSSNAARLNAGNGVDSGDEKAFKLCGSALTTGFVGVVNISGAAGAIPALVFSRGC